MTFLQTLFYVFASIAIFASFMVVISKNPVHSVLFLVMTFFATAGVWMLLHAEFLALILVLVYVGAVMTLFLFVVMMLNIDAETFRESFVKYLPFGALMILLVMGLVMVAIGPERFGLINMPTPGLKLESYSNVTSMGLLLYTEYAYPFEIAAILLLTAIVAAISLTHRPPMQRKVQNVNEQLSARPSDRLKIIKMPFEKRIEL